MSTKEEAIKNKGFEFCHSFMGKCYNPGSEEEKGKSLILKAANK